MDTPSKTPFSPALVEGLVASVDAIIEKYSRFVKETGGRVLPIFVGTGLDAIKNGRVGTRPDLSQVVSLVEPNVDVVLKEEGLKEAVEKAVKEGEYSSVLVTNARMFFRGVLPTLCAREHVMDSKKH